MMNPESIDLIRRRRRELAGRWSRDMAAMSGAGPIWWESKKIDRHALTGMDAFADSITAGRADPFVEFAGRFGQEVVALEVPADEVVRALTCIRAVVLGFLAESGDPQALSSDTIEAVSSVVSAGILECTKRYEHIDSRRGVSAQERIKDLRERARRQVVVDPVTGMFNANHFALSVRREITRGRRFGRVFSVALLSLDQDEALRESLGEEGMRAVLVKMAGLLTDATRHVDVRAFLGGSRFGLVLPETPLEGALEAAERIRHLVEGTTVTVADDVFPVTLTVSVGLAAFPEDAEDDRTLLERAEEAHARARQETNATMTAASPHRF